MKDLKVHRDSLAILSNKLSFYLDEIRAAGFTCCHVDEDWIRLNCTEDDIAFHQRYSIEFAHELLISDSPSAILFSDEENCRSQWLNELKAKRLADFGPEDRLFEESRTRHLLELSPCLRELARIRELPDQAAQKTQETLVGEFAKRWSDELKLHKEEINSCISKLGVRWDESSLQRFYAAQVAEAFSATGARLIRTVQIYGPEESVSFDLGKNLKFVLLPTVSCSSQPDNHVPSGKIGMGYRLTTSNVLKAEKFDINKYIVLNLFALLPNEFIDYGRFNNIADVCLNILARIASMKNIVPDVVATLEQEIDKANI